MIHLTAQSAMIVIRKSAYVHSDQGSLTGVNPTGTASIINILGGKKPTSMVSSQDEKAKGVYKLAVQFNPNRLQLQVTPGEGIKQKAQPTKSNITQGKRYKSPSSEIQIITGPTLVLNVTLIFDAVNNQDAFTSDKLQLSIGSVVGNVPALTKEYSVQEEVEGLIATVAINSANNMGFHWGEFIFEGVVVYIKANYTMFNTAGSPIRAEVALRLRQTVSNSYTQGLYNKQFKAAFKASKVSSGVTSPRV